MKLFSEFVKKCPICSPDSVRDFVRKKKNYLVEKMGLLEGFGNSAVNRGVKLQIPFRKIFMEAEMVSHRLDILEKAPGYFGMHSHSNFKEFNKSLEAYNLFLEKRNVQVRDFYDPLIARIDESIEKISNVMNGRKENNDVKKLNESKK